MISVFAFLPLLIFLSFVLLLFFQLSSKKSKKNLPPSPPNLPFIRNFHQLGLQPHRSLQKLSNEHGPMMMLQFRSVPVLIASSAEAASQIMKTQDMGFAEKPMSSIPSKIFFGPKDVAFTPYGTITRELVASTSQPKDNNTTNAILAYLVTMSRNLAMENERLDHMVGQREKVGCPSTCQEEGRNSYELRGESTLVCELLTTSEGEQNDQSDEDDLDLIECIEILNYDCPCEERFDYSPWVARDDLYVCEDYSCERETYTCLEILSTSSLCVSYLGHMPGGDFETSSKCMHENPLFEVDLWNTFLKPLFFHDISNGDKEGMLNFEDDILGETESERDLSPWLLLPFDLGTILG
ncbi:hypothetical protein FXO37_02831 [Capsicum annuum]|nr:hypothetical protein FXO37_02831 [Capsicum annuum]